MLNKIEAFFPVNQDLSKLLLRISVAVMMLPHGITKLPFFLGLGTAEGSLAKSGFPTSLAVLTNVGEIVGPLMILLGWKAKIGAVFVICTMFFALFVTVGLGLFGLDAIGDFKGEKALIYILVSLVIIFAGSGVCGMRMS